MHIESGGGDGDDELMRERWDDRDRDRGRDSPSTVTLDLPSLALELSSHNSPSLLTADTVITPHKTQATVGDSYRTRVTLPCTVCVRYAAMWEYLTSAKNWPVTTLVYRLIRTSLTICAVACR